MNMEFFQFNVGGVSGLPVRKLMLKIRRLDNISKEFCKMSYPAILICSKFKFEKKRNSIFVFTDYSFVFSGRCERPIHNWMVLGKPILDRITNIMLQHIIIQIEFQ